MAAGELLILGCGSATPTTTSNPTSQLVSIGGELILLDCGEGTQVQLRRFKAKFSRINRIFISHLHGDHYFGLVGLISSFHLLDRSTPLYVYGPPPLEEILRIQLQYSHTSLKFQVVFVPTQAGTPQVLVDTPKLTIGSFPLDHSIAATGFKLVQKPGARHLNAPLCEALGIPGPQRRLIKYGAGFTTAHGRSYSHEELTLPADPGWSYAFATDTAFSERVVEQVAGVDVLYHESTFANTEAELAEKTQHSTAHQAALVASKAGVGKLLLGHYSVRYTQLDVLLNEARAVFPATELSREGLTFALRHES